MVHDFGAGRPSFAGMTCPVFFPPVCFNLRYAAAQYSGFALPDKKAAKKFRCNFEHITGEKFFVASGKKRKHEIQV
jgi:hypothetical protein